MKKILLIALTIISPVMGMKEITTYKTSNTKESSLFHDGEKFTVSEGGIIQDIPTHRIDNRIRNINSHNLNGFLSHGYLTLDKNHDGQYSLKADGRVKGGGIISAWALWGITTVVGHGVNLFMAKKVAKAVGAKVTDKTGRKEVGLTVEVAGPLALTNSMTNFGVSGLGSAGATIFDNCSPSTQQAVTETGVAVAVVSGGNNVGWVEAAANAAFNIGMKIPKL